MLVSMLESRYSTQTNPTSNNDDDDATSLKTQ